MMSTERIYSFGIAAMGVVVLFSCLASLFLFVNIPCRDDWELVGLAAKVLGGEIHFSDFWSMHAEHRMFFTRLILTYWAAWTSWDLRAVPWVSAFLVLVSTICLSRSQDRKRLFLKNTSFWIAAVFTFALSSQKTINWAVTLNTYLATAPVLVSFYILTVSRRWSAWTAAAILTAFASFSFGIGLAGWAAMLVFFFGDSINSRTRLVLLWCTAMGLTWGVYFMDFSGFLNDNPFSFLNTPGGSFHFFLVLLGAIFHPLQAEVFGIMGVAVFASASAAFFLKQASFPRIPAGLYAAMMFVIMNGFMITASRSQFGTPYALADRYMPLTCIFWGAAAVWLTTWRWMGKPLISLAAASILLISPLHWMNAEDNRAYLVEASIEIQKQRPDPAKLLEFYEIPGVVEKAIPLLKEHRLAVYK